MEEAKPRAFGDVPAQVLPAVTENQDNIVSFLTAVEGGRVIDANNVHAEFAKQTQNVTVDHPMMAGFAILAWNDEGEVSSVVHKGARNPFSVLLIPGFASDMFKADVISLE